MFIFEKKNTLWKSWSKSPSPHLVKLQNWKRKNLHKLQVFILLLIWLYNSLQSFGLLNQLFPSSSILGKGLPVWYFYLLYIFSNIIPPSVSLVFLLAFLIWASSSKLSLPFSYLASFQCDRASSVFVLGWSLLCSSKFSFHFTIFQCISHLSISVADLGLGVKQ